MILSIRKSMKILMCFVALTTLSFSTQSVKAQDSNLPSAEPEQIAVVKEIEGSPEIHREGNVLAAESGSALLEGDELVTKASDRILLELASDKSLLKINYDSTIRLQKGIEPRELLGQARQKENQELSVFLVRGLIWGKKILTEPPALNIRTSVAVLAVRGTEFFLKTVSENISEIVVKEGTVDIAYDNFGVQAGDLSRVFMEKGKKPRVEGVSEDDLAAWVQAFA